MFDSDDGANPELLTSMFLILVSVDLRFRTLAVPPLLAMLKSLQPRILLVLDRGYPAAWICRACFAILPPTSSRPHKSFSVTTIISMV
ncbi:MULTISPECIES: hypothetical protein [unclassified Burkholderia]|uniref:hypothetical protein n=1 Tax=unclassified Burkholderia TaxID=2613784 RepID=UPI002AAFCBB1|nr:MULTISPECIES: hypothetical protein [unclassified Burkholderia]